MLLVRFQLQPLKSQLFRLLSDTNPLAWPKSVGLIMRYGAYTPTVCQAFSDTAGKYRLGASFKNVSQLSYLLPSRD